MEDRVKFFGVYQSGKTEEIPSPILSPSFIFIYQSKSKEDISDHDYCVNTVIYQDGGSCPFLSGEVRLISFVIKERGRLLSIELSVNGREHDVTLINNQYYCRDLYRTRPDCPYFNEWDIKMPVSSVLKAINGINQFGIETWKEHHRLNRFYRYLEDLIQIEGEKHIEEKRNYDFIREKLIGEYDIV